MPKTGLYIRVDSEELKGWQVKATEQAMSLSAWIRENCNHPTTDEWPSLEQQAKNLEWSESFKPGTVLKVSKPVRFVPEERKPCKHGMLFCKTCK